MDQRNTKKVLFIALTVLFFLVTLFSIGDGAAPVLTSLGLTILFGYLSWKQVRKPSKSQDNSSENLNSRSVHKSLSTISNNITNYDFFGTVHKDILDLLWIADGPNKNYTSQTDKKTFKSNGVVITFSTTFSTEPSLIKTKLPIKIVDDIQGVERPPYYPTYEELTPQQRGVYYKLLQNPYQAIDIGFVFILYYGLERHLLQGKFNQAFEVILKLRDVHSNKSFQNYSSNALILTAILNHKPDMLFKMYSSIDKVHEELIPVNSFLLMKLFLEQNLSAKELIRYAKDFYFTNTRYIKSNSELFIEELDKNIISVYGENSIPLSTFFSPNVSTEMMDINIFANISIETRNIKIPNMLSNSEFVKNMNSILLATHEKVKKLLAENRKNEPKAIVLNQKVDMSANTLPVDKFVSPVTCKAIGYTLFRNDMIDFDNGKYALNEKNATKAINDILELNKFITEAISLNVGVPNFMFSKDSIRIKSKHDFSFIMQNKLTPSGKMPKYPITLHFFSYKGDSSGTNSIHGELEYLADGRMGQIKIHQWVSHQRHSIFVQRVKDELKITSIETSNKDGVNIKLYKA